MGNTPKLPIRGGNGRSHGDGGFVAPEILGTPTELPWYSVAKIKFSHLVAIGTLLLTLFGAWYRLNATEQSVAELKATVKTRESADSDMKLVLSKLDDLRERVEDLRQRLEAQDRRDARK